jgi:hypothetical protein
LPTLDLKEIFEFRLDDEERKKPCGNQRTKEVEENEPAPNVVLRVNDMVTGAVAANTRSDSAMVIENWVVVVALVWKSWGKLYWET